MPAKPNRRWWQYSISTLLLLMAVVGALLALVANPARRQRLAVEYVESVDGRFEYAREHTDQVFRAPGWLRRLLGKDAFETVIEIDLHDLDVTDNGLSNLDGVAALKRLDLSDTGISDAGVVHLRGLTALRSLSTPAEWSRQPACGSERFFAG